MEFRFGEYEDWMKDQVVEMFCKEYGNDTAQFIDYFDKFYSGYQKNKALRLVILDEKKVAGFVSFSYWPYRINGKVYRSYQCGNVIIHENYRGKGLYNKLLDHVNQHAGDYGIELLVGFPIKQILKLYLKSRWQNPFDLQWFIKIMNPLGAVFKITEVSFGKHFDRERSIHENLSRQSITLDTDKNFYDWNKSYNNLSGHYFYTYKEGQVLVEFALKLNKRRYVNELIVGEINTGSRDEKVIARALKALRRKARRIPGISMISFCMNEKQENSVMSALLRNNFRKIDRSIKFIVNPLQCDPALVLKPENWELYRRDLDTW